MPTPKGSHLSPEHRMKLSQACKGKRRGPMSAEQKVKISASRRGTLLTQDHKDKLAITSSKRRMSRTCKICGLVEERAGASSFCASCRELHGRARRAARARGTSIEQYLEMAQTHNGTCDVCGSTSPGGLSKKFHMDHDHQTLEIRGFLCTNCNPGLGFFRDDPALLRAAALYIERSLKRRDLRGNSVNTVETLGRSAASVT